MTRAEFKKWLKALRSKKYQQGEDRLRNSDNMFCCLGVYLDAVKKVEWKKQHSQECYSYMGKNSDLPDKIVKGSFYSSTGDPKPAFLSELYSLADLNDGGHTFEAIADILEKNTEEYVIIRDKVKK